MFKLLGTSPVGISKGDKFAEVCRATSSPFITVSARYSWSRLISASTNGAKSQRNIHFPRLTTQVSTEQRGPGGKDTHFFDHL